MKSSLYPMKSIGLSDLGTDLVRLIALRAMLVSDRSYGAERHRMRSSVPTEHPDTSIDCSIAKGCEYTNPTPSQGLKDHLDTSIARQGYEQIHPGFLGLKDRWIFSLVGASSNPA